MIMKNSNLTRRRLLVSALITVSLFWAAVGRAATVMNIEIDYMVLTNGHSHRPQASEVAAVVQMFACHGITLNIVISDALPHVNVMQRNASGSFFGNSSTSGFLWYKNNYFDHNGQAGWHYCIFGHQYQDTDFTTTTSSGLGENGGDDFVVTLGAFTGQIGTPFDRASTLAHEFGHNLTLSHGQSGDYQPNKPSIMSYFYQLRGVRTAMLDFGLTTEAVGLFKEMDYSEGRMIALNELALSEARGTGMTPVDWNCNGTISGNASVSLDSSRNWCSATSLDRTVLADVNEWASLTDNTSGFKAVDLSKAPEVRCITAEEARKFESQFVSSQPSVVSEPCISAKMIYLTPGALPAGNGTGGSPYTMVGLAHAAATSGSHLIFLPGTYSIDTGPVILNKPMTLFSPVGTTVIKP